MTTSRMTACVAQPGDEALQEDAQEPPARTRPVLRLPRRHAPRVLIIVDHAGDWPGQDPDCEVIEASRFLSDAPPLSGPAPTVVNLCRSCKYLSIGYYCSLMAEARGYIVLPSVKTINDLSRKAIYSLDTDALDEALDTALAGAGAGPLPAGFSLDIQFGRTDYTPLALLAQRIFDTFPTPLMRVEFSRDGGWHIAAIRTQSIATLGQERRAGLGADLKRLGALPRVVEPRPRYRYRIAILHDPDEALPPSNPAALAKFVEAGRQLGVDVSLIGRHDSGRLNRFDALFIRETTAINHHTYLFAKKAESEGIVVIDDPMSILRCTNKVYLADLLRAHAIPIPRTYALGKDEVDAIGDIEREIGYPMVLKIPDGAFSRGVSKVHDAAQFRQAAAELLRQSALVLVQEYMYTEFDWRIGVLDRQPVFASKYFMSQGHWQVAKRDAKGNAEFGMALAVPLDTVPPDLLAHAVQAANLIGDGLYGVDMKMTARGPVVIEVNDNPNIDAGAEDSVLGDELYRIVMRDLVRRLDRLHLQHSGAGQAANIVEKPLLDARFSCEERGQV